MGLTRYLGKTGRIIWWGIAIFLVSCSSETVQFTPSLPATFLPSLSSTPTVLFTPSPSSTPTLLPTVETPTEIPVSLMGLELSGSNFQKQANFILPMEIQWIRRNGLLWSQIEPEEGVLAWENAKNMENQLVALSQADRNLILIVRSTPIWAQRDPGITCGPIREDKFAAFGKFMFEAVKRYSQPPFNVKFWELGNEPDVGIHDVAPERPFGCWGDYDAPYFDGGYYAEMLKKVYPQIKAADPQAQVLIGGLLLNCDPENPPLNSSGEPQNCLPSRFLEGVLLNGGGDFFDGISFHAYDYYNANQGSYSNPNWHSGQLPDRTTNLLIPVVSSKTRFLKNLLNQYGHSEKYLLITETALICGRDGSEPGCQTDQFQQAKARYLVQSYSVALAEGLRANIWFSLLGWRGSGLTSSEFEPNPVFIAYQFAAIQFNEAIFIRQVYEFSGVLIYEYQTPDKRFWVLWSSDGTPIEITLPAPFDTGYDMFGELLSSQNKFFVGPDPLYLEWQ